jgi:hypothetical protein
MGATGGQSTSRELLERYLPVLRYDSNETFFADAVEVMAGANNAFQLTTASGEAIAPGPVRPGVLRAGTYSDGRRVAATDRLTGTRRDYREQAFELHPHQDLRNVVYAHAQRGSDDRLWLQYWYFYLYNDAGFAGNIGLHEGDWEMVQVRLAGEEPDLAVYAQHDYSERREWGAVEREGDSPVVYPGRGTHASYFEPGLHRTKVWWDIADGMRPAPPSRLVDLDDDPPSWLQWPGRWGGTEPRIPLIDSPSPPGPAGHEQWADPQKLLELARDHESREPPPAPRVRVRRRLGHLVIGFDVQSPVEGLARSDRIVLTVNSPDEQAPPRTYTFPVDSALRGRIVTTRELDPVRGYDVRTSIVDVTGVPTAVATTKLPALSWVGRVLAGVQSMVRDLKLAVRRI